MDISRRDALRTFAAGATAAAGITLLGTGTARADGLGTLIDYSAGVPHASSIRSAGYQGVIRYCSDPRADWMGGKPLRRSETQALRSAGLEIVSCYQYGKGDTSDWLGGHDAGVHHAKRGLEIHRAAGGPDGAPIYMSIDSNPSREQFEQQVLPFLQGCESVLGHARTGVYCNAPTIDWAIAEGVGAWFWQHDWGSGGRIHDKAQLHQRTIDADEVDGIGIDLNTIRTARYGQWSDYAGGAGPTTGTDQSAPGTPTTPTSPEAVLGRLSDSAGDPTALLGDAGSTLDRISGLADRAIGLAGRLAARIG